MKLRTSSSIAQFKERAERTFGLKPWEGIDDPDKELLFFGLYHERDYDVFDRFDGKKIVLWAGGDILRLTQDYERRRVLNNHPQTEHFCENEVEAANLKSVGIEATVIPSFLDDINNYPVSFDRKEGEPLHVWMCAHPEREDEYGVPLAKRMAGFFPHITFHVYGVEEQAYDKNLPNVKYHGQVEESKFNKEIKKYHCGFRPNHHDGFSEVIIKSILLGQYPISRIPYDEVWNYKNEDELKELFTRLETMIEPNYRARTHWIKKVNQYPFCKKHFYEPDNN